jgi:hypothetical protein
MLRRIYWSHGERFHMEDHMNQDQLLWVLVAILAVAAIAWLMVRAVRWAKKGTRTGSMLAAAACPFPEQPPPHEQVENANRLRKDAESGDPE